MDGQCVVATANGVLYTRTQACSRLAHGGPGGLLHVASGYPKKRSILRVENEAAGLLS